MVNATISEVRPAWLTLRRNIMPLGLGKESDRRAVPPALERGITAALELGVEVEGKMQISSGTVRLNTTFKGEIVGQGAVVVGEQGEVEASIQANSITIRGKVKGAVRAAEKLEIQEHGVLLGDIDTPVLIVEPGGYFDGHCHMPTPNESKEAPSASHPTDKSL
jgi:cytoskeletal protein CcmA (bactofilin family)